MPEYSSHAPGTFCWPELSTTDQPGAVAFYRTLLGWEVTDYPMGPTETYSMFTLRGLEVASAYTMRPEEREHGAPPHWNSYVSTADADESVKRAQALGGTLLVPPFDVMDSGRMATLQDPTGAVMSVWQPKHHIGARILQEAGALGWTELMTNDTAAAETFYTQLFGWTSKISPAYTEFNVGPVPQAGMMKIDPKWGNVPPHWMPYFQVDDCDVTAANATAAGGRIHVPPTDIPNTGRFAMLGDPQGATFAVITLNPRP
ncbi:MAG: VOC family protein [Acidobacteriota bacterium]